MPLLTANVSAAHAEYMDGRLAHGAYNYCLSRQAQVLAVLAADEARVTVTAALKVCSMMFLDLRTAVKDLSEVEKPSAQAKVDELLTFYKEQGFTETNPVFDIPAMPIH